MRPPSSARLVTIPLEGVLPAYRGSLLVRGDARPFALTGNWAGGGALVGSEPICTARPEEDPFALLDEQPEVDGAAGAGHAVGGGWFGYLGYSLGRTLEPVPPSPPRPVPLPPFALSFYDHLLRLDPQGRWWFEALWTDERDAALRERLARLSGRLSAGVRDRPVWVSGFAVAPPGPAGHTDAVGECRARIASGEIFQANVCLRLDGHFEGNPADLFARAGAELSPRHGAYLRGPWGALVSLSPELFLRREGRHVLTEPIKGTAAPDEAGRARLAGSGKDVAENVMIVDLMRNDLGRVCEYGSVSVPELTEPRPAPGVWHLVSSVTGTLRPEVGDADLLRATFPPGSVTGAPKIQTMRVIAELEATGREAYTGAIGYASPVAGLELSVAIRTLEIQGDRIWLGAGGGITSGSEPEEELAEALLKARPVIEAAGGRVSATVADARDDRAVAAPRPPNALDGTVDRPDPERGVFTTMRTSGGRVLELEFHLARLAASVAALYDEQLPEELEASILEEAGRHGHARLRVRARPRVSGPLAIEIEAQPAGRGRRPASGHPRPRAAPRRAGRAQVDRPPAPGGARGAPGRGAALRRSRRPRARSGHRKRVDRGGRRAGHAAARRPSAAGQRPGPSAGAASRGLPGPRGAGQRRAPGGRGRTAAVVVGQPHHPGRAGRAHSSFRGRSAHPGPARRFGGSDFGRRASGGRLGVTRRRRLAPLARGRPRLGPSGRSLPRPGRSG